MTFRIPSVVNGITQSVTQIGNAVTGRNNDAKYFNTSKKGEIQELKQDLHSKNKEKKKEAIKKVIAAMTIGKDVSGLFPDVINCIQTSNIELKRLVYLYIINYAKLQPELAILAINTFRKDCLDSNPMIRALAVRTIGCIQLKQMEEYLVEPLRRACKDGDAYVRKTAATCICKLYDVSPKTVEQDFLSILKDMLFDSNATVVANALASLTEISEISGQDVLALNDSLVTRLLTVLSDSSEWGQVFILDALARYNPKDETFAKSCVEKVIARLSHANAAVVLSSIRVIFQFLLAIVNDSQFISNIHRILGPPLISLLASEPEVQYVVLRNISIIVQKHPKILVNDIKSFFCKYNDPAYVKLEKIEIMVLLSCDDNIHQILQEFSEYVCEVDVEFVRRTIRAIGRCAVKLPKTVKACIESLLSMMKSSVGYVIQEVFIVTRDILRCYPENYKIMFPALYNHMHHLDEPESRAAMVWIIGEYCEHITNAVELLESFLDAFQDDSAVICQQILTSSVKLFLKKPNEAQDLVTKVLKLCTETTNDPDLRDRVFYKLDIHGDCIFSISSWLRLVQKIHDVDGFSHEKGAKSIAFQSSKPIDYTTFSIEPHLLNVLMTQLSTMSSVFHRSPSFFFSRPQWVIDHMSEDGESRQLRLPLDPRGYLDVIKGHQFSERDISPKQCSSDQNIVSGSSEMSPSSSSPVDFLDSPKENPDSLEGAIEVLSSNSQGCQGETGLSIYGLIRQTPEEEVVLELQIRNERSTGILYGKDWAIQVNKNVFGFAPKSPTNLGLEDISPGGEEATQVVLIPNVNTTASCESIPLVLQVAVKTSVDIFYLKPIPFSPSIVWTNQLKQSVSDMTGFNSLWEKFSETQKISFSGKPQNHFEPTSLIQYLTKIIRLTVVSVKQDSEKNQTCFYLCGGTVTRWLILMSIVIKKDDSTLHFHLRGDKPSVLTLLQNFLVSSLKLT